MNLAQKSISRYKAALTHLAISVLIAAITLLWMLFVWYPPPLFSAMGGWMLIFLIIGVDVALGPLITLIIFDVKKGWKLVFDLSVIALLQIAALSYGVYAMHAGRPVYVAFNENRFVAVAASEVDQDSLARAQGEFARLSLTGPRMVAVKFPEDAKKKSDLKFYEFGRYGTHDLPEYLVPYAEMQKAALAAAYPLEKMRGQTAADQATLAEILQRLGKRPEEVRFLAVVAALGNLTALLDAESGALIEIIAIDPAKS